MTDIGISYYNADRRGKPSFEVLDQLTDLALLAGSEPELTPPVRILLADSLSLAQFTVVGLNLANHLTPALEDGTVKPIGVLVHAAASGVGNTTIHGEVFLTGNFNAGSDSPLVWDASFTTLAQKTGSVVGNPALIFRSREATGSPAA